MLLGRKIPGDTSGRLQDRSLSPSASARKLQALKEQAVGIHFKSPSTESTSASSHASHDGIDTSFDSGTTFESRGGQRMRLNVSATVGGELVCKVLVVMDEGSSLYELSGKIQSALRREGVHCLVINIFNSRHYELPTDERLGDMLADGEEVVALVCDVWCEHEHVQRVKVSSPAVRPFVQVGDWQCRPRGCITATPMPVMSQQTGAVVSPGAPVAYLVHPTACTQHACVYFR
jgi:hypothetical protein